MVSAWKNSGSGTGSTCDFSKSQTRLHLSGVQGEMVTPTGAGIVAALSGENQLPDSFVIEKSGLEQERKISLMRMCFVR